MKKLYFLLLIPLLFTSCKKNVDAPVDKIVGRWHLKQNLAIYYQNSVEMYREILPYPSTIGADAYIEFKADGSLIIYQLLNNAYATLTGTYALSATSMHVDLPGVQTFDRPFAYEDDNTFNSSATTMGQGTTFYTKNGVSYPANGETVISSYYRL